tara:strand:- start:782 stop:1288 length:507 start_codon:yes stop_codon:yes gene_type:complete
MPPKGWTGSSKLKRNVHNAIVRSIANGNWIPTAAKAANLDPQTVNSWIQIGRGEHPTKPAVEPFVSFAEDVQKAMALAEEGLVAQVKDSDDWRAKAWLLERGPARDRWSQNILVNAQIAPAAAILDNLRSRAAAVESEETVAIEPLDLPKQIEARAKLVKEEKDGKKV